MFVLSFECTGCKLSPFEVLDEGRLNRLPIWKTNNKVWEASIVGLVSFEDLTVLDNVLECGGVVACLYVGKLFVEGLDLLTP